MKYYNYLDIEVDETSNKLYEASFKELKKLTTTVIAKRLKRQKLKVKYVNTTRNGIIKFKCSSGTIPGKWYNISIKLLDFHKALELQKDDPSLTNTDIVNLMVFGDIAIFCECKDWLYSGKKFMAWNMGYGLHKEDRFPKKRNPQLKGALCKHTLAVVNALPFHISSIQKSLRLKGAFSKIK